MQLELLLISMAILLGVMLLSYFIIAPVGLWIISRVDRLSNTICKKNKIMLPSELFALVNLEHLDLSGNKLDELPKDILKLTKLKYLNIGELGNYHNKNKRNSITVLPKELFLLPNLESLNISGNQIKTITTEIKNAKSLKYLNASSNQLESLPQEIVNTNIKTLNLEDNDMHTLPIGIEKMKLYDLQIDISPNLTLTDAQKEMLDKMKEHEKRMSEIF